MTTQQYHYALGRRKSSTARVRLQSGKGNLTINDKSAEDFFQGSKPMLHKLRLPLKVVDLDPAKFDISIKVVGGGTTGQVEAIQLAIAKALTSLNNDLKSTLRRADMLGRDPREKERKKPGLRGARRKQQFTKR